MHDEDESISPESQGIAAKIEGLLADPLEAMGYGIVRVQLTGGKRPTLQIMAERTDGGPMSVDDCADISRATSAILDVEDPIKGAYHLEVSSPGIDRPLIRRADFIRFAGFEVKLDADRLIDGRKRFKGRLLGVDDQNLVRLRDAGIDYVIPFGSIVRAKLVLTDDLLKTSPDHPVL
jgi:ribosome maturation factor RimP